MNSALERKIVWCRTLAEDRRYRDLAEHFEICETISVDEATLLVAELASFGGTEWLRPIMRKRPSLDGEDRYGRTALANCIFGAGTRYPTLSLFYDLLRHGADPNRSAAEGLNALQIAIEENKVEYAVVLLGFGADPYQKNIAYEKCDAFEIASKSRRDWAKSLLARWAAGNTFTFRSSGNW